LAVCPGFNVAEYEDPANEKPVPVTDAELTDTGALPLDVKVTVCVTMVFNATLPNPTPAALMLSTGPDAPMVIVRLALPAPPLLIALRDAVEVPVAVGVPEISPVPLFTVSPTGNPVAP
jgi:hypothetical protein